MRERHLRDEKKRRYVEDRTEQQIGREVREIMRESEEYHDSREDAFYGDGSGSYNRRTRRAMSRRTDFEPDTREARRRGDSGAEYREAVGRNRTYRQNQGYAGQNYYNAYQDDRYGMNSGRSADEGAFPPGGIERDPDWEEPEEEWQSEPPTGIRLRKGAAYTFVSYVFIMMFVSLIGYLVFFNFHSDKVQNSPYNRRQDSQSAYVRRGDILDSRNNVIATTKTDENGKEIRVYEHSNMFAHVIGYSTNGKSGVESIMNYDLLTSHDNFLDRIVNEFRGEKNTGDTVVTTLDLNLQQAAYNALGDYQGAVIVIDPQLGSILAMVSKPDFDPNTIAADWEAIISDPSGSQLVNRATQGLYPPGSTYKIVTALSYMQQYGTTDGFTFNCEGEYVIDDYIVHCYDGTAHGEENFGNAFANSCNCSFAAIGLGLGTAQLTKTSEELLFGKELPCDLHYNKSRFNLTDQSDNATIAQTAFGQAETLVTPYHLALITSAIANRGMLMQPQLVGRVTSSDGTYVENRTSKEYGAIMSEQEADALKALMVQVVNEGTAAELSNLSYSVAGKTGSAEYTMADGQIGTHSWFTGFSNVDDPDIVVVVLAENGGSGSATAVPIAHAVFDAYYNG